MNINQMLLQNNFYLLFLTVYYISIQCHLYLLILCHIGFLYHLQYILQLVLVT